MSTKPKKDITILFVDDDLDFRTALASTFERKGYRILTAANGQEASEILRQHSVNAIISDIKMPNGDGIELLDRTRNEHPEMPIILLVTGFADVSTEEAHDRGAEALFSKPLDIGALEDSIERLLTPPEKRWASSVFTPTGNEIKVEIQYLNLTQAIEANKVAIGRGGMFVTLQDVTFPNINDEVKFKITFNSGEFLQGNGIVRWIRTQDTPEYSSGFGLEFMFLEEENRKKIIEYINSQKNLKTFIPKR